MSALTRHSAIEMLAPTPGVTRLNGTERAHMTVHCRDTDYITKVPTAGTLEQLADGRGFQSIHFGVLVEAGDYFCAWIGYVIRQLRGHHEPQEKMLHEPHWLVRPG